MRKPKKNRKSIGERGTPHLAETVKRLEKRVAELERKAHWPEVIPLDDEAREIYEAGLVQLRAGHVTPSFKSMAEFKEWNAKNSD